MALQSSDYEMFVKTLYDLIENRSQRYFDSLNQQFERICRDNNDFFGTDELKLPKTINKGKECYTDLRQAVFDLFVYLRKLQDDNEFSISKAIVKKLEMCKNTIMVALKNMPSKDIESIQNSFPNGDYPPNPTFFGPLYSSFSTNLFPRYTHSVVKEIREPEPSSQQLNKSRPSKPKQPEPSRNVILFTPSDINVYRYCNQPYFSLENNIAKIQKSIENAPYTDLKNRLTQQKKKLDKLLGDNVTEKNKAESKLSESELAKAKKILQIMQNNNYYRYTENVLYVFNKVCRWIIDDEDEQTRIISEIIQMFIQQGKTTIQNVVETYAKDHGFNKKQQQLKIQLSPSDKRVETYCNKKYFSLENSIRRKQECIKNAPTEYLRQKHEDDLKSLIQEQSRHEKEKNKAESKLSEPQLAKAKKILQIMQDNGYYHYAGNVIYVLNTVYSWTVKEEERERIISEIIPKVKNQYKGQNTLRVQDIVEMYAKENGFNTHKRHIDAQKSDPQPIITEVPQVQELELQGIDTIIKSYIYKYQKQEPSRRNRIVELEQNIQKWRISKQGVYAPNIAKATEERRVLRRTKLPYQKQFRESIKEFLSEQPAESRKQILKSIIKKRNRILGIMKKFCYHYNETSVIHAYNFACKLTSNETEQDDIVKEIILIFQGSKSGNKLNIAQAIEIYKRTSPSKHLITLEKSNIRQIANKLHDIFVAEKNLKRARTIITAQGLQDEYIGQYQHKILTLQQDVKSIRDKAKMPDDQYNMAKYIAKIMNDNEDITVEPASELFFALKAKYENDDATIHRIAGGVIQQIWKQDKTVPVGQAIKIYEAWEQQMAVCPKGIIRSVEYVYD